jgi:hypothetical protein
MTQGKELLQNAICLLFVAKPSMMVVARLVEMLVSTHFRLGKMPPLKEIIWE